MRKLQYVKMKLLDWNRSTFGRIGKKRGMVWDEIQILDKKLEEDGSLPLDLQERCKVLLADMDVLLRCEEIHWSQKVNANG